MVCLKETVGQFVGITDKNGLKAFSGDLFYWNGYLHEIVYRSDMGAFMACSVGDSPRTCLYMYEVAKNFRIAGNTAISPNLPTTLK